MSLTIAGTPPATRISRDPTAPSPAAAPAKTATGSAVALPPAASTTASNTTQRAALAQLLSQYTRDQSHGADARKLSALGQQIMAAAKAVGQHVTLPSGSAPSSRGSGTSAARPTQAATATATPSDVNVTA